MKTIYTKENVKTAIGQIHNYFRTLYDKDFSVKEIINAFNNLNRKYQDLMLKPNKNENDKVLLRFIYEELRKVLMNNKEDVSNVKIKIKALEIKKTEVKKEIKEEKVEEKKEQPKRNALDYIDKVNMDDEDKIIILYKYESENEVDNKILARETGFKVDEINDIVSRFWILVDNLNNDKTYKLEIDKK